MSSSGCCVENGLERAKSGNRWLVKWSQKKSWQRMILLVRTGQIMDLLYIQSQQDLSLEVGIERGEESRVIPEFWA